MDDCDSSQSILGREDTADHCDVSAPPRHVLEVPMFVPEPSSQLQKLLRYALSVM